MSGWVGHSCPTKHAAAQAVWVGHSCPTESMQRHKPCGWTLQSDKKSEICTASMFTHHRHLKRMNVKINSLGQECPSHTAYAVPTYPTHPNVRLPTHAAAPPESSASVICNFLQKQPQSFPPEARDAILRHCLHDNEKRFHLHAAVVMPDHVHLLLTPLQDENGWPYGLPKILKLLKGTSARSVNKFLGTAGPVWQEESFDHVLRSQESLTEKLEYIRQNPVRRSLVTNPEDYRWLWIEPGLG